MTKLTGKIIEKKGENLLIEIEPDDCSSCGHHGECSIVDKSKEKRTIEVDMFENADNGDTVEMELEEKKIIQLSVLFYLFPSFTILIFALSGFFIFHSQIISALSGFLGVLISIMVIYVIDKKKKNNFKHKITRVIK